MNNKHRQLVQAITKGDYKSNTAAYQALYPRSGYAAARSSVSRLLRRDSVSEFNMKLRHQQLEKWYTSWLSRPNANKS